MTDSDPREKHSGAAPDFPCPTCGKARIMVGTLGLGLIFKPHDCAPSDPIDIIEERLRALADLVELVGLDDAPAEAFDVSRDTAERELIDTLDTAASLLHSLRAERDDLAAMHAEIAALDGPREHICACPKCGVTLTVPCAGEIVADVKVGGVKWEACDVRPIRTN